MSEALFYPWIDIRDEGWLKASLLCWDSVRTIVPESIDAPYSIDTGRALEAAGFLVPLRVHSGMEEIEDLTEDVLSYLGTAEGTEVLAAEQGGRRHDVRPFPTLLSPVHFENAEEEISREYIALGHQLGWRFLYTPARTFNPEIPLFFLGLNPGGDRHSPPQASVETGNAFRVEAWGANNQPNSLQLQVVALYERVAAFLPSIDGAALMDRSLAANFCPFRSPSWAKLPAKRESTTFSRALWSCILRDTIPAAFISLTALPARHLVSILRGLGWRQTGNQTLGVGWGAVTCSMRAFENGVRTTLVVRLPHLSRFQIIGRPESDVPVEQITREIATRISQPLA